MGVCAVDTSEVTINTIRVDDAVVAVDTGDSAFDVDVPAANIFAQLGEWEGRENVIGGAITVWDTGVDLKTAGSDGDVLDPDYDRETFRASYACKADLLVPQDYACPDLKETVVSGAARLLLNNAGNAVQAAVSDARCGFASPGVVSAVRLTGETGYDGGEAVFTIDSPCTIEFPELSTLSRTRQGKETKGQGRVLVRGTMRQRGRLTGDPAQPIIPTSRDAVEIVFDVSFDGWSVGSGEEGSKVFVADAGGVTGRMRPRLAKDESTGACSIPTPVVTFDNLAVKPGTTGLLRSGALAVRVDVDAGTLNAQVGNKDGVENTLAGTISATVLGEDVSIDVGGELDPDYDAGLAVAAFSCTPYLKIPVSDDECSFDAVIAENSARLAVQTAGNLASMINADDSCGFEDTLGVLLWPSEVIGSSGEMGSMSWDVVDCGIERADNTRMSSDCLGGETFVEGFADFVDVGRTVRGEREKMLLGVLVDSIVPREEDAVDVFMREVQLSEFATWSVAAGADAPAGVLVIHEGTLSATVQPALGARADDPETVDVPAPVARISSLHLSGDATLFAQGKTFHFRIDDADLLATNGAFMGAENSLSGAISIDGERHDVHAALNPDYDASAFDNGYSCNEVLLAPVR